MYLFFQKKNDLRVHGVSNRVLITCTEKVWGVCVHICIVELQNENLFVCMMKYFKNKAYKKRSLPGKYQNVK